MKSFKAHLESVKSHGEKVSLTRRPIYRASAIFTVFNTENLSTRILYMGYWMLKKNIPEVGLLITLRNQTGEIIFRSNRVIDSYEAQEIEVRGLLIESGVDLNRDFLGSVELEIFSTRDLVYPYPGFVVNYYNGEGSGVVHTTGRIYNDYEIDISVVYRL